MANVSQQQQQQTKFETDKQKVQDYEEAMRRIKDGIKDGSRGRHAMMFGFDR